MTWTADDVPRQDGRTFVVTGANTGLGFETSRALAERGAEVVMACRSRERGRDAAAEIDGVVEVRELDLASLDSVESFASGLRDDHDDVDVLVNNAGVMAVPRRETEDGFELQFGVNHLGHYALTGRLLPLLRAGSDGSRVVTVSSGAHRRGEIDFDDLMSESEYSRWGAYAQSKLANLLFALELDRRFRDADDIVSLAAHPGYAATDLQRRAPEEMDSRLHLWGMRLLNAVVAQSAERGALPQLYAATAEDVEGGGYYGPGGFMNMRGYPERQTPSERARDTETAERLWRVSRELTDVDFDF
ncbi:MAG: oxidoreductase [Halobacteriota archaeon]